jgi:hypothetical protein
MPRCFCVIVASSEYIPNSGKTFTKYENYRVLVGKQENIDKMIVKINEKLNDDLFKVIDRH